MFWHPSKALCCLEAKADAHYRDKAELPTEVQRTMILEMEKRLSETTAVIAQELRDASKGRNQLPEESEQQAERIVKPKER